MNAPDAKTATFIPAENKFRLNQASGAEKIISLGYAENRILQMLIENHGEPVSREEITDFAWNDRVVAPGSLSQAIFNLRNILGDNKKHDIIQTVPRRGYRLNSEYLPGADSDEEPDISPELAIVEMPIEAPAAPRWKLRGLYGVILFSAGLIAVGLLAYREIATALQEPLQETTISREKSTIHLLTLKNSPNSPAYEDIAKQAMKIDAAFDGEAWLTVHVDRYRISCLAADGSAVTEEVSVDIPLSQSLQLCQAAMHGRK